MWPHVSRTFRRTFPGYAAPATGSPVTGWTAQAHLFADAIREPGFSCAALNASAWAAGVNPQATGGLLGAALALTDGQAGAVLWDADKPCESDRAFLEAAAELEGAVAELLGHATRLARDCRAAWEGACEQAGRAAAGLEAESPQASAAAQAALDAARPVIADCEAALEVIDGCGSRLAYAANCLRKVPGDLASTYETPYQHVRDGGTLPYSGDFLGGIVTIGAQ